MTKQQNIPIQYHYNPKTEGLRLLFTAKKLATYQYQAHRYVIIPKMLKKSFANLIIFPKLPYQSIPDFWHQVKLVKQITPPQAPKTLISSTISLLNNHNFCQNTDPVVKKLKTKIKTTSPKFFQDLFSIMPDTKNSIKSINLYPTKIGSIASFNLLSPNTDTINIYLRLDQSISVFFEKIISSIIRHSLQTNYNFTWTETEAAKDSLILNTNLKKYFPKYNSVLTDTRNYELAKLQETSQKYLNILGLTSQIPWQIKNRQVFYLKKLIKHLSSQETRLLKLLIENYNQTTTYDQIFQSIWPYNYNVSIYAISKLIQRLRKSLKLNHFSPHLIQTQRKRGYLLTSFISKSTISEKHF
ncbi:MAG: helix-turn-helix domain-containing protein [Patescibacteria group bacterium]|nr:helix-turn-helix domain-containing protein [Patescibacteria group bacterium]